MSRILAWAGLTLVAGLSGACEREPEPEPEPQPCAETDSCLADFAPCESDAECASGHCEPDPNNVDGQVCLTIDCVVDDDCDTAIGEFCVTHGACGTTCTLPVAEDEQCGIFPDDEACAFGPIACAEGLFCVDEGVQYVCRRPGRAGTPCDPVAPACDEGLACDATLNVCQ